MSTARRLMIVDDSHAHDQAPLPARHPGNERQRVRTLLRTERLSQCMMDTRFCSDDLRPHGRLNHARDSH